MGGARGQVARSLRGGCIPTGRRKVRKESVVKSSRVPDATLRPGGRFCILKAPHKVFVSIRAQRWER